jgi:hypothetical protein
MKDLSKPGRTNLSERMRLLSRSRSDLPENWLALADSLDDATQGFFGEPQTVNVMQFMGHMARARKAWCAATGDPLV